jgi:hypothetical protein
VDISQLSDADLEQASRAIMDRIKGSWQGVKHHKRLTATDLFGRFVKLPDEEQSKFKRMMSDATEPRIDGPREGDIGDADRGEGAQTDGGVETVDAIAGTGEVPRIEEAPPFIDR